MDVDICPAENYNFSLNNAAETCPNKEFSLNKLVKSDEAVHSMPCYNMDQFNKSDYTSVVIINATQLMNHLTSHEAGMCAIVLFYANWCPFSLRMALFYNALGRLYSGIPTFAVHVESQVYGIAANQHRHGIVAVPNLLIFQNQRAIGRYNGTDPSIANIVDFVSKFINLSSYDNHFKHCSKNDNDTNQLLLCSEEYLQPIERDHLGPISLELQEHTDWLLLFSICFLIALAYSKYAKR